MRWAEVLQELTYSLQKLCKPRMQKHHPIQDVSGSECLRKTPGQVEGFFFFKSNIYICV